MLVEVEDDNGCGIAVVFNLQDAGVFPGGSKNAAVGIAQPHMRMHAAGLLHIPRERLHQAFRTGGVRPGYRERHCGRRGKRVHELGIGLERIESAGGEPQGADEACVVGGREGTPEGDGHREEQDAAHRSDNMCFGQARHGNSVMG